MAVVVVNTATRRIQSIMHLMSVDNAAPKVGPGVTRLVFDHLVARDSSHPNRLGGQRTHFYSQAAQATTWEAQGGDVRISIAHLGVRQRFLGGVIRPVNKKALAIPARAEAYGKTPGEFQDLKLVVFRSGASALVQADQSLIRFVRSRKDGTIKLKRMGSRGGLVMFWLVKSVRQAPDPGVLPTKQALAEEAITTLDNLWRGGAR